MDYARCGGVALQRSGHFSPVEANTDHDGIGMAAEIEWLTQDLAQLDVSDANRVTEDGAEAVALSYAHSKSGWVVKRRLQRRESADWLLGIGPRWLALEVSGMASGNPHDRLKEKREQVSRCSLPAERLAVVVLFSTPTILAATA